MRAVDWLANARKKLTKSYINSANIDASIIIEHVLGKSRIWVGTNPDFKLSKEQLSTLDSLLARRAKHEPISYITSQAWFYGRQFTVSNHVMIPRPESEGFINLVRETEPTHIYDIGTGSGCLAITSKLELPKTEVSAIDISPDALLQAKQNAKKHQVSVDFIHSDLLINLPKITDDKPVFLVNLPYVPNDLVTSIEITHEPRQALFSGPDGLEHYKRFWQQIIKLNRKPQIIMTESLENQHNSIEDLAKSTGYKLTNTDLLVQAFSL